MHHASLHHAAFYQNIFSPPPSIPINPALPASRSVRPYTSYELEQIRQQGRG